MTVRQSLIVVKEVNMVWVLGKIHGSEMLAPST